MDQPRFVVGVDGGGTKTLGELADLDGNAVATHAIGPTNPHVVGPEESARTLCSLIRLLCTQAHCRPRDVLRVVLGLAGGGGEKNQRELQAKVKDGLHEYGAPDPIIDVVTDIRVALEGAFDGGPGIAVVAGTGSSIMYKTPGGEVELIGGWGRILGDEGSGYFIGLEALRAVIRDYDGIATSGQLREAMATRFGLGERYRFIEAVYRQHFPIPSLAPLVFDLAAKKDPVSCEILERASSLLGDRIASALAHMGDGSVGIVLFGGLLEHDTPYKEIFVNELTARFPQVRVQPPLHSAVQGAVMMALSTGRRESGV
jgi:glucosamine kinase